MPKDIPPDWKSENLPGFGMVIEAPRTANSHGGFVTIDFERRDFSIGMASVPRSTGKPKFAGLGWRAKLMAAAVADLKVAIDYRSDAAAT